MHMTRTVRVSVRWRGGQRPPAAQLRPAQETDPQALGHADPPGTGGRSILVKTQSLAPERHRAQGLPQPRVGENTTQERRRPGEGGAQRNPVFTAP